MEKQQKPKGLLHLYLTWPFLVAIPIAILAIWFYVHNESKYGFICVVIAVICLLISLVFSVNAKRVFIHDIAQFISQYQTEQLAIMKQMESPLAFALRDGRIVWMNDAFTNYLNPSDVNNASIKLIAPDLKKQMFPSEEDDSLITPYAYDGREGEMTLHLIRLQGFPEIASYLGLSNEADKLLTITLNDLSDLHKALQEKDDRQIAAGLLYIDNYDELIEDIEEIRQSLVAALIEQEINQYIIEHNGLIKKTENDKYFFAVCKRDLKEMEEDKFKVLEIVKSIQTGINRKPTLSIGIGLNEHSYTQSSDFARTAISLALARGGDQAVIKDEDGTTYYGGKAEQASRNTRVKARVKAHDLCELLMQKDSIYIMGHLLPDADSLGSAIGIYRIAESLGRKAHIIIDHVTTNLQPLYQAFLESGDYPADLFVRSEKALEEANADTMLIVVDTNIPTRVECAKLLDIAKTIVVFDHHRQTTSTIQNPTLSYIEPYASSASEMITEIVQYTETNIKLTPLEANALYAGMVIDTNHFVNRTGVRTFEAASVLRRAGADVSYVRKKFRDDLESYKYRALIISSAQVYKNRFAIATFKGETADSPTIIGAQAANELLNIEGIQASFVLTRINQGIYISARSIDEVNVQIMMERMGGGGHINIAGAQLPHTNLDEAVTSLKELIDQMIEKGNL